MLSHVQRKAAEIALDALNDRGYALAGSSALSEHNLISRPTKDVDLFADASEKESIADDLESLIDAFDQAGVETRILRQGNTYAKLEASVGHEKVELDIAVDYRQYPAVELDIGPVIDERDAIANKAGAMFSRGEARDYFDTATLSGRLGLSGADLARYAAENDAGVTEGYFKEALRQGLDIDYGELSIYGITDAEIDDMRASLRELSENRGEFEDESEEKDEYCEEYDEPEDGNWEEEQEEDYEEDMGRWR